MSKKTTIARKNWDNYVSMLRKLSDKAESELNDFLLDGHTVEEQIDYAYALVTKYGEGAAELACQMHEALANISNVLIPPAEPAPTATYYETAKAIRGTMLRTNDARAISASAGRLVKLAGVDTMMKNALRDGCEWAWIPSGDTCPYCIMLASNGWQKASKKAIKNGHAEHIHNNCDCAYVVRFSDDVEVEGYNNGKEYLDMYKKQKGIDKSIIDDLVKKGYDLNTPKGRMAAMRRQHYANNRDYINAQKRAVYARQKELKESIRIREGYSKEFDSFTKSRKLTEEDLRNIQTVDKTVVEYFQKDFPGYKPAALLNDTDSESIFEVIPNNSFSFRIERHISNIALPAGDDHVDIGNPALANSIHERAHDLINCLAMKRAGIIDESNFGWIEREILKTQRDEILRNVFIYCFDDEDLDEINAIINKEFRGRASAAGELIPEGLVSKIGLGDSKLADKIYEYLLKEWNK